MLGKVVLRLKMRVTLGRLLKEIEFDGRTLVIDCCKKRVIPLMFQTKMRMMSWLRGRLRVAMVTFRIGRFGRTLAGMRARSKSYLLPA